MDALHCFRTLDAIEGRFEELRQLSTAVSAPAPFLGTQVRRPAVDHPQLGFLQAVGWLNVKLWESGRVACQVLEHRANANGAAPPAARASIAALRTYLLHDLDPDRPRDAATEKAALDWLAGACGTGAPFTEQHWFDCLGTLLADAERYLGFLASQIREIENDGHGKATVASWSDISQRERPTSYWDDLIRSIAETLGQPALDVAAFRRRHIDRWESQLRASTERLDELEDHARRLVETAFAADRNALLPIRVSDIQARLPDVAGAALGRLVHHAYLMFIAGEVDRDALLDVCVAEFNASQTTG